MSDLNGCAYRAKNPAPIREHYDAFVAESDAHSERVTAWLESYTPEGQDRRGGIYRGGSAFGLDPYLLGIKPYPHERKAADYPLGWRKRVKDDYLTPYGERAPAGVSRDAKDAAARIRGEMDALAYPKGLRTRIEPYGMPRCAMRGNSINTYALRCIDGEFYVYWAIGPEVLERGEEGFSRHKSDLVDLNQWERLPLSQWYAALEAEQEAKAPRA